MRSSRNPSRKLQTGGLSLSLLLLGIFLAVLYIAIDPDEFTTGNIYSIVAYPWIFVATTEYLPELLESWTALKDIAARLKTQEV